MVARNEGMTKTYNRFHDPNETAEDIQRLRELHAAMDRAVLEAYGWHDLAARAEPIFLDETNEDDHTYQGRLFWPSDFRDEVLARLLALNAERHAEEVRLGMAPGMKEGAAGRGRGGGGYVSQEENDGCGPQITGTPRPGSFERACYSVRNHGDGTGTVVLDWYQMSDGRDYLGSEEFMRAKIEAAREVVRNL